MPCSLLLLSLRREISDFFSGGVGASVGFSLLTGAEAASLALLLVGAAKSGLLIKASKQGNKTVGRKIIIVDSVFRLPWGGKWNTEMGGILA